MAVNAKQAAKRAFVKVLLALAATYGLLLQITRDSGDTAVVKAFRQVARRAHPDKGGSTEDAQRLNDGKQACDQARQATVEGLMTGKTP